jgi:hypothetical protein
MSATRASTVPDVEEDHGHGRLYVALAPWVVFTLLAQHSTLKIAAADHATGVWLARYSRAIAAALLASIALGSLFFTPFTEQYARESVPRKFWHSPTFEATNRRLTTMWALVFAAMVPSHVLAGAIDKRPTNIIFNWVA